MLQVKGRPRTIKSGGSGRREPGTLNLPRKRAALATAYTVSQPITGGSSLAVVGVGREYGRE